ncbi:MAG: hypothetical protein QW812_04850 [Thermoplasmataceae archaeon]
MLRTLSSMEMFSIAELRILEEIKRLEVERITLTELRKQRRDLFGYYLNWIEKRENRLLRKYVKKYNRWPELKVDHALGMEIPSPYQ